MKNLLTLRAWSICLTLVMGCANESIVKDNAAAKIESVQPQRPLGVLNDEIELVFSKPVINFRNLETCIRFAKSDQISEAQLERASKVSKSEAKSPFMTVSVRLSANRSAIKIALSSKLDFNTPYSLWIFNCLKDDSGNTLISKNDLAKYLRFDFVAEDGPFTLTSHNLFLSGNQKIPLNRTHFFFRFSHAIAALPTNAIRINDMALDARLSSDQKTIIASRRKHQEDEKLLPGSNYQFIFDPGILDSTGRSLSQGPIEFEADNEYSFSQNSILREVEVLGYENFADVLFHAENLVFAHLSYGSSEQQLECLGLTCLSLEGPFSEMEQVFAVAGLDQNKTYYFELAVEDLFGRTEVKKGEFQTRDLPQIAINEIFASPIKKKGVKDSNSEFIELYNFGDEDVSLADFTLEIENKTCVLNLEAQTLVLPAKSFMLLVGKSFEPQRFGLSDSPAIHRMHGQTICGNLRNWPLPQIVLRDGNGRRIDKFTAMSELKAKGHSIERLNPSEKNGKEKFCYSRLEVGPTPLRTNGVVEKGCEEN